MGELSFNFKPSTESQYLAQFKYWFENSIEYSFAYRRYISLSDTSIFNSPVAITKVATGLSDLYELFVDKQAHSIIYNKTMNIHRVSYNIYIPTYEQIIHKQSKDIIPILDIDFTEKNNSSDLSVYHNLTNKIYTNILNKYRNDNAKTYINTLNKYNKEKWGLIQDTLFSCNNFMVEKIHGNNLDIYKDLYWICNTDLLNIYYTQNMASEFTNCFNIYDDVLVKRPRIGFNILNIIFMKRHDILMNIYDQVFLKMPRNGFNIYEQNLIRDRFRKNMSLFTESQLLKPINQLNIIENVFIQPKYEKILNISEPILIYKAGSDIYTQNMYSLSGGNIYSDINTLLSQTKNNPYVNIFNVISGNTGNKIATSNNIMSAKTSDKKSDISFENLFIKSSEKNILQNITYRVTCLNKSLVYFNIDDFTILEQKYCISLSNIFVTSVSKFADIFDYTSCFKTDKSSFTDVYSSLTKCDKDLYRNSQIYTVKSNYRFDVNSTINLIHSNKNINHHNIDWILKEDKYLSYFDTYMFGNIIQKNIIYNDTIFTSISHKDTAYNSDVLIDTINKNVYYNNYIFADKSDKNIYTEKQYFSIKSNHVLNMHKVISYITKNKSSIILLKSSIDITKNRKSLIIKNWLISVYKNRLSFEISDWIQKIFKDRKSMEIRQSILDISKERISITEYHKNIWTLKIKHDISILYQDFMEKTKHDIEIFSTGQNIIKNQISVHKFDIDNLFKYYIPTDILDGLIDNNTGAIIPVSKVQHEGYIDTVNNFIYKIPYNGYINTGKFSSVIPRFTNIPEVDLLCDKVQHKLYIQYKNVQITKQRVYAAINKSKFVLKLYRDTSLYDYSSIQKTIRNGFIPDIWQVSKVKNHAFIKDTISIDKKIKLADIDNQIFIDKTIKKAYTNNDLFIEKIPYLCYYSYDIWADKNALKTQIESQLQIYRNNKNGMVLDMTSGIEKDLRGWYDYDVFPDRLIQNSELYQQINEVHKTYRDTGIRPDDFGNWAWVYETPDPFSPGYGIDELLLPENDTKYEHFKDIIFNKETLRPRNPVKVINDTTFIAKYPTKHPIQKYEDVAVNYDDSAIKIEQYYGIEVDIMHTVFLKYYRIWQSKIFEFSTMTMVQAVKTMLDYLYTWIMEYFPVDKIEQALRVFKLIRWYGESAIIQNSQYIISYEYDTLESKLTTGKCLIPSDMDPDANNYVANQTMIVDASLGVIKANPTFVGVSEAHVEFYIKHKKNTSFTFSLSNTVGSVNIYINGNLVDTLCTNKLNATYQLPYQGDDMSIVRIEKDANSNKSPIFYIGHIIVPNASFKDLSIEFDPVLRAGNKPLDEMAKKMISCANLYDNRDEMYAIMKKNNLGLTETYRMMSEYWELHHKDKTKGKRLTIKQV